MQATDKEVKQIERSYLRSCLHSGVVRIVFEKKDGTEREMWATLNPSLISKSLPENDVITEKEERSRNESVQPVFDVENGGWRSFRWDSLKEVDTE